MGAVEHAVVTRDQLSSLEEYRRLYDASLADISDYAMFAVADYVANLTDELEQELQDAVESLIVTGGTQ